MSLFRKMSRAALRLALAAALIAGLPMPVHAQGGADAPGLTAFSSDRFLREFLRNVLADQRREEEEEAT